MNRHHLKVMINKDILELFKEKSLLISLMIIPIIFSIVLPVILFSLARQLHFNEQLSRLPISIEILKILLHPIYITDNLLLLYTVVTYLLLPLFMMIPVMLATVLSSTTLLGEKEKKTLDGLLYTPITIKNLILGKVLGAAIPSIVLTWIAILVYIVLVNILGWSYFGHMILPNLVWMLMTMIISPLLVILSILLVLVSSQYIKTAKSAQGIAMILILPIITTFISQAIGGIILGSVELLILISLLIIIILVVFFAIVKLFDFEKFILN